MAKRRPKRASEFFSCPNCGADVPTDALACPECGSDAETGWSEDTLYDGVDLPDDESFLDDDHAEGFEDRRLWKLAALAAIAAFLLCYLIFF